MEIIKYFTLAKRIDETYGHGDYGQEYHICPIDAYHTDSKKFHPLFKTSEGAQKYKDKLKWGKDLIIVEMEVYNSQNYEKMD